MSLLNAGSGGCCLRWSAMASTAAYRQVGDERHGRCALVSPPCCGDGGEVLMGSDKKLAASLVGKAAVVNEHGGTRTS